MHVTVSKCMLRFATRLTPTESGESMYFDELRDAFHMRLGRLTHAMTQMDLSIGLALNWLGENNDLDISNLLDPAKARLSLRLHMLKKLVDITADQRPKQTSLDFENWFERANQARALKVNYVNARWSFRGMVGDEEPYVMFQTANWQLQLGQSEESTKLTLREFDSQIDELKRLNYDFGKLCDCHAEYTRPALKLAA